MRPDPICARPELATGPHHAPKNPGTVGGNPTYKPTFSTCLITTNYSNILVKIWGIIHPEIDAVSTTQTPSLMTALGALDSEKSLTVTNCSLFSRKIEFSGH